MVKLLWWALGAVSLLTVLVYFGGQILYSMEDSDAEVTRMMRERRAELEAQWEREDQADRQKKLAQSTSDDTDGSVDTKTQETSPSNGATKEQTETPSKQADRIAVDDFVLESADDVRVALGRYRANFEKAEYDEAFRWIDAVCLAQPNNDFYQAQKGKVAFMTCKFPECVEAYDQVIKIDTSLKPQLWQRGLALYYADQFKEGVEQFEQHQKVNSQDVENSVWHFLCEAKVSNVETARKQMIDIQEDSRIPMYEIFEMFAGRKKPEDVIKAAQSTERASAGSPGHKLQLYYAYLYVGLFQEINGDAKASLESMNKAKDAWPLSRGDFMGEVARVHIATRTKKN
ncbi:MAG: hypothetical protein AAFN77_07215 [Planctomycetota bacterium]